MVPGQQVVAAQHVMPGQPGQHVMPGQPGQQMVPGQSAIPGQQAMPGQPGMQAPPVQQAHPGMAPHQGGPAGAQVPQAPQVPQPLQAPPGMPAEQPVYPVPPAYQGPGPDAMAGPGGPGPAGPHQATGGPQPAPALAGLPGPMPGQAGPAGAVPMQQAPGGPPGPGGPAGPAAQQGRGAARAQAAATGRFTREPQNQQAVQGQQFPGPPADQPEMAAGAPYMPPQQGMYAGQQPAASQLVPQQTSVSLADAVQAAHGEGFNFGQSVARDAPALWLEAVLARKPRMPSDLEARLLQDSALPIDSLLHDEVRHALRRGFWDALERARH